MRTTRSRPAGRRRRNVQLAADPNCDSNVRSLRPLDADVALAVSHLTRVGPCEREKEDLPFRRAPVRILAAPHDLSRSQR